MSSEAVAVLDMPNEPAAKPRRGRRPAEQKQQSEVQVLFYLGERSQENRDLVLGSRFETEGLAMVEALKRDAPFYRVEVWKSRAVVKDGSVEIKKEPVTAELADPRADGFRKTNR
jgi:hypothetical protein